MSSPQHVSTRAGEILVYPEEVMYIVPPQADDPAAISRIALSNTRGTLDGLATAIWSHTLLDALRERLGPFVDVQLCGLADLKPGPTWLLRVQSVQSVRCSSGPGARATAMMIDGRVLSLFDGSAIAAACASHSDIPRGGSAGETDEPATEIG